MTSRLCLIWKTRRKGARRIVAAINTGLIPAYEELTEDLRETEDELTNLTDDTLTTSEQFSIMKNRVLALVRPFSETIAMVGAILIPLGFLAIALGGVALAAGALGTTILPLLAVILAVIAAVTIGVLIFKNWDKIVAALGATWDFVWNGIKKVFDIVWGALDSKIGKLVALFLPFGPLIVGIKLLAENWDAVWNGIKAVVLTVSRPIVGVINGIIACTLRISAHHPRDSVLRKGRHRHQPDPRADWRGWPRGHCAAATGDGDGDDCQHQLSRRLDGVPRQRVIG